MKKIYFLFTIILLTFSSIDTKAQTITWTDNFTQGVNPTPAQIANWNNFKSQLLGSYCYTKMTISGTFDPTGQVCNDPSIVLAYANALRTLTNYTSPLTNGNVWSLCASRYQGEVWLNPPSQCSGSNCPFGYIIRPGGPGAQYGAVNSNTCSPLTQTMTFTFEYAPVGAPTVTCPSNVTVNNDAGNCDAVVNYTMPTVFSCDSYTTTQTAGLPSGSTFPIGITMNTFYASNAFGNDTCSFTVIVNDTELPTISCPTNIVMNNDSGICGAVVTYTTPAGADNCTGVTTVMSSGLASGSTFPIGVTTVTYLVTDASNNQDSCSFTVTVTDTTKPTVVCPTDVASCDPVVNGIAATTSDNCTGESVAYTLTGATTGSGTGDASGTTFNVGMTTVQYLATDTSGNQDSCSFTVTINPLPTVAIAAFTPDTVCETEPAITLPVGTPATGTYSGNGVVGTTFDPSTAGVGAHYVMYTFTDSNSCTNMDSTMIVVISCVGVDENGVLAGVNIYPNPTNNIINITLGNITSDVNLTLTSIEGKVIYQENNVSNNKVSVDLSNNSKGIYFLKVETNNQYKVYKVIKE